MNTDDFTDLADQIAAAAWTMPSMGVVAAYQKLKENQKMQNPSTTMDLIKLVSAGSHSCTLAMSVINSAEATEQQKSIAVSVLRDWGLDLKPIEQAPPDPTGDEFLWPPVDRWGRPLEMVLDTRYFERDYVVHEELVRNNVPATSGYIITPSMPLKLLSAHWDEEKHVWRMHFQTGVPGQTAWLSHCAVRPLDKTPATAPQEG